MKEQLAFGNFDKSHSRNDKDKYLRRGLSADPVKLKKSRLSGDIIDILDSGFDKIKTIEGIY